MQILTEAPFYIWPLLLGLTWLGLRAMRDREVPLALVCGLPCLGFFGLASLAQMSPDVTGWVVFAVVWSASSFLGYRLAGHWVLGRRQGRVMMRGERVTFLAFMLLFWANFTAGVLNAIKPEVLQSAWGGGLFAGLLALASGHFAGRAVFALRLPNRG